MPLIDSGSACCTELNPIDRNVPGKKLNLHQEQNGLYGQDQIKCVGYDVCFSQVHNSADNLYDLRCHINHIPEAVPSCFVLDNCPDLNEGER